jgi:SRSO17 transposase
MRRNPFRAVLAAIGSLFGAGAPKKRTVQLPAPSPIPAVRASRRDLRAQKRARLSNTWSRTMAQVRHPVASMWRAYCADRGVAVTRTMGGLGWKSWKKQARKAVAS